MGIAAVGAGAAVAGGAISAVGSMSAADTQASAQRAAAQQQVDMFNKVQANVAPYIAAGQPNLGLLDSYYKQTLAQGQGALGAAGSAIPGLPSQADIINTPGYNFALDQGLKATQTQLTALGLGRSGNAIRAADNFATGLASQTYQNQFNNQQTRYGDLANQLTLGQNLNQSVYDQLYGPAALGESAAVNLAAPAAKFAAQQGEATAGAGASLAAGQAGAANALGGGLSNGVNSGISNYLVLDALKNGGFGGLGSNTAVTNAMNNTYSQFGNSNVASAP